ncbi:hypothetical protein BX600DRAFT_449428 [Xylariales sp. PMI_506]|nr:hypothetical protein BX600DRAFT_449428 [Xylariales sp. PMI_506]
MLPHSPLPPLPACMGWYDPSTRHQSHVYPPILSTGTSVNTQPQRLVLLTRHPRSTLGPLHTIRVVTLTRRFDRTQNRCRVNVVSYREAAWARTPATHTRTNNHTLTQSHICHVQAIRRDRNVLLHHKAESLSQPSTITTTYGDLCRSPQAPINGGGSM